MKKYRVSLAMKIPCNFEVVAVAKNKKEALEKALEKYDDGIDEENIVDVDWDGKDTELDINKKRGIDGNGSGIFIEEVK